ncbi:MAG: hypothetical protein ACRES5_17065 [Pseudomonas sp.]
MNSCGSEVSVLREMTVLVGDPVASAEADSPDLVIAKLLLDHAKLCGFEFQRTAPGEDGPLVGHRVSNSWVDLIHIEGFNRDCFALRKRRSRLIIQGDGLVERRVDGRAIDVLNEVLTWEMGS